MVIILILEFNLKLTFFKIYYDRLLYILDKINTYKLIQYVERKYKLLLFTLIKYKRIKYECPWGD